MSRRWKGRHFRGTPVASLPPAPPTVWLVHSVNGQPAGPSPYPCAGVHKPPEMPSLSTSPISIKI